MQDFSYYLFTHIICHIVCVRVSVCVYPLILIKSFVKTKALVKLIFLGAPYSLYYSALTVITLQQI